MKQKPEKPNAVPNGAQWLSGQGAGVWFFITYLDEISKYRITRYSPEGEIDCDRLFEVEQNGFNLLQPYEFIHISHCAKCRIKQNNQVFVFNWVGIENQ